MDDHKPASEWGQWEGFYYITEGVTAVVGGGIASYMGFNALFIIMTVISFFTGVYLLLLPRRIL